VSPLLAPWRQSPKSVSLMISLPAIVPSAENTAGSIV
jgi:hypothetical protein